MPITRGELWQPVEHPAIYVVTTNASINKHGELVMGRGAALQATKRIPGIAKEAAKVITHRLGLLHREGNDYGFVLVRQPRPEEGKYGFGVFQVKKTWDQRATIPLISFSMNILRLYILSKKNITIRMNYPGIGNGGLPKGQVSLLLQDLPKNLHIFYK
jgi:hypothetical protein